MLNVGVSFLSGISWQKSLDSGTPQAYRRILTTGFYPWIENTYKKVPFLLVRFLWASKENEHKTNRTPNIFEQEMNYSQRVCFFCSFCLDTKRTKKSR